LGQIMRRPQIAGEVKTANGGESNSNWIYDELSMVNNQDAAPAPALTDVILYRVCKIDHSADGRKGLLPEMNLKVSDRLGMTDASINIVKVEKDSADGLLVMFSDGTVAGYVVEGSLGAFSS